MHPLPAAHVATAALVLALAAALAAACDFARSDFGRPCVDAKVCDEGSVCLDGACRPPRAAGEPGESCATPLAAPAVGAPIDGATTPVVLSRVVTTFGDATDDVALDDACEAAARTALGLDVAGAVDEEAGPLRDVVVTFTLDEAAAVRIRVDAAFPAVLAVRGVDEGACVARDGDRCGGVDGPVPARAQDGNGGELVVPALAAGTHAVVVTAAPIGAAPFTLTVERLPCPVGYAPFDDDTCLGFRSGEPLPLTAPRSSSALLPDGRVAIVERTSAPPAVQVVMVFDPDLDSWSQRVLDSARAEAAVVALDDVLVLLGLDELGVNVVTVLDADLTRELDASASEAKAFDIEPGFVPVSVDDGFLVVAPARTPQLVALRPGLEPCNANVDCDNAGAVCVEAENATVFSGICVCVAPPCDVLTYQFDPSEPSGVPSAGLVEGFAAIPFRPSAAEARVFIHGFGAGGAASFDVGSQSWAPSRTPLAARTHAAVLALDARVVLSGGLDDGGAPSPLVEILDTTTDQLTTSSAALTPARSAHAMAGVGDGFVVAGGRGPAGVLDDATLFKLRGGALTRTTLADLPAPRASMAVVPLDEDRVLLAGGVDDTGAPRRDAWLLERVPAVAAPAPDASGGFCGVAQDIVLEQGAAVLEGSTAGGFAELRPDSCADAPLALGLETTYVLDLAEPASVHLGLTMLEDPFDEDDDVRGAVWLWRGDCEATAEIGCSGSGAAAELEASLPAGKTFIVVEGTTRRLDGTTTGAPFSLSVRVVGDAGACLPDAADPEDDDGSTPILPTAVTSAAIEAAGIACPGDIDHVLIPHVASDGSIAVAGIAEELVAVMPVVVDEAASLAAGRIVATPLEDRAAPVAAIDDAATGYYLARLAPFVSEADGAFVRARWQLRYSGACVLDDVDALVPGLDDEARPAVRRPLVAEQPLVANTCTPDDVDVLPLVAPAGAVRVRSQGFHTELALVELDDAGAVVRELPSPVREGRSEVYVEVGAADRPERLALRLGPTVDPTIHELSVEAWDTPHDTCAPGVALPSDAGEMTLDLTETIDDADAEQLGDCTGYSSGGSDAFFRFHLDTGDRIRVNADAYDGPDADVALYILDACPPAQATCVAGVDVNGFFEEEQLTFTNTGSARDLFLVVDGYFFTFHTVDLEWTITRAP